MRNPGYTTHGNARKTNNIAFLDLTCPVRQFSGLTASTKTRWRCSGLALIRGYIRHIWGHWTRHPKLGAAQELQNFRELSVNVLKIKSGRSLCNKRKISARSSGTTPASRRLRRWSRGALLSWQVRARQGAGMEYDKNKMDEVVMALLYLTMFDDKPGRRAWKSHDWDTLDRLHEKGTSRTRRARRNRW